MPLIALLFLSLALAPQAGRAAEPSMVAYGREIAQGAGLPEDHACARCHGLLGTGEPGKAAPRLAGQPRLYLEKQLEDFANGLRPSEAMVPIARALTPERRAAAAAYYSSLHDVPYPPQPAADPVLVQVGGVLSAVGDGARDIRACEICHADAGVGIAPSFPYLAGQEADYLERELLGWKLGLRRNDPLDVMAEIARAMTMEEIRASALYFARVRPAASSLSSAIPSEPIPPAPPPVSD